MCDFKPGDELVAVDNGGEAIYLPELVVGSVYVCTAIDTHCVSCDACGSTLGVQIAGVDCSRADYCPCSFRKVERRTDKLNLTEWLAQPTGYDEEQHSPAPKAPAKRRERA